MKILLFALSLFSVLQNVSGQLTGKLVTANGQPVPFANVLLLKSIDTSFVHASLTSDTGVYEIKPVAPGKYILRFSSAGYQTWDSQPFEITTSRLGKDFGTQIMKENIKQLDEVVVTAEKPLYQQKAEGLVLNVESSVLTKGSSVLQVLERSPGVVIDRRNNGITLNGKSGVMLMLNGKLMRMPVEQVVALLNGMSADDVSTVELLTTPPARYDAEGNAGMINIVSKKNKKQGTNGAVSLTGGYGWREKGAANINVAHNRSKVSIYGSYSFLHDRSYSDMFINSSQNMPVLGGEMVVLVWDTTKATQNNHDATLRFDVKLNSKTTIGSNIIFNSSARTSTNFNQLDFTLLPDSLLFYQGSINGTNRLKNLVSSIYAERQIGVGEKINFDMDYLCFKNKNPSEVQSHFINKNGTPAGNNDSLFAPRQKGFANTTIQVGVVKADYTKQLNKKLNFEAGVKGTFTKNISESGIESLVNGNWVNRSETVDNIVMNEGIGAVYSSVNAQLNTGSNLVVGARYEYASTQMDNPATKENLVKRRRGVLFPSVSFSKKLTERSELQLSFTKRISRPSYNDLAAFIRYSDPTAVYTGNPLLKPTITNNVKLGYNYQRYSFSILVSRDDNSIARYQLTKGPSENLLYVSPQNLAYQDNVTFQTNLPLKVKSWWNMSFGFVGGLRRFKVDHTLQPVEKTYFGYSLNFSQDFKLLKSFSLEVSGWYNAASFNGSVKVGAMGALNAAVKKELKNNGGSFQLSVSDLLRNMRINSYYGTLTGEAFSIKNHVAFNTESRKFTIVKLSYSKLFGSGVKAQAKDTNGSKDERERIRKE